MKTVKTMMCAATALAVVAWTAAAEAKCETRDLSGRWDVYGLVDLFAFRTHGPGDPNDDSDGVEEVDLFGISRTTQCTFRMNNGGRLSESVCTDRFFDGSRLRYQITGKAEMKRNCTFLWTLVDRDSGNECIFRGSMTRSKELATGIFNCASSATAVFTMVKR